MAVTDRELWALALRVERDHGDDGTLHIVKRIGEASRTGDRVSVDLWTEVAVRYSRLHVRPTKGKNVPTSIQ